MKNLSLLLFTLLFSAQSFAGLGYKSLTTNSGIAAPIEIQDNGIYNLVINVEFLREPYDTKSYTHNDYAKLIQRLNVEWTAIAIETVLAKPNYKIADLAALKNELQQKLNQLIGKTKPKYNVEETTEVVYSIDSFYIIKPE